MGKLILSLCDYTGNWSKPYKEHGYDVQQVDIRHGQDVRLLELPKRPVWGILAAPPCTHFAVSGARWWKHKSEAQLIEALSIVDACIRIVAATSPNFWVLKNPVGRLTRYLGKPAMYFQPCDYGDPYTKKTGLWGSFHIPIKNPVEPTEGSKMHLLPPSEDRWMKRSETPMGFAYAFFEANR